MATQNRAVVFSILAIAARFLSGKETRFGTARYEIPCSGGKSAVQIYKNSTVRFTVNHIGPMPVTNESDNTAPKPENLKVDWYVYNNRRIVLSLHWIQKTSDIMEGIVKGYYLRYGKLRLRVDIALTKTSKRIGANETYPYAEFVYRCIGRRDIFLKPGRKLDIKLFSLPMPLPDMRFHPIRSSITIPACCRYEEIRNIRNSEISTPACKECWEERLKLLKTASPTAALSTSMPSISTERMDGLQTNNTIYYVFAPIVTFCILITVLILIHRKFKRRRTDPVPKKILMVANSQKVGADLKISHSLVGKLRQQFHINITSNWERQRMIEAQAFHWYAEQLSVTNLVIFIVDENEFIDLTVECDSDNAEDSELRYAVQLVKNSRKVDHVPFEFLLLGDTNDLQSTRNKRKCPYRVYDTSNTFWKFLTRITGVSVGVITLHEFLQGDRTVGIPLIPSTSLDQGCDKNPITSADNEDSTPLVSI